MALIQNGLWSVLLLKARPQTPTWQLWLSTFEMREGFKYLHVVLY